LKKSLDSYLEQGRLLMTAQCGSTMLAAQVSKIVAEDV
jgi:hypothetical protein